MSHNFFVGADNHPPLRVENAGFKRLLVQNPALKTTNLDDAGGGGIYRVCSR